MRWLFDLKQYLIGSNDPTRTLTNQLKRLNGLKGEEYEEAFVRSGGDCRIGGGGSCLG
jgi:hypothetical protein